MTPPGRGGISTLSLFGPEVHVLLQKVLRTRRPLPDRSGCLVYGHIVSEAGQTLDEVIVHLADSSDPAGRAGQIEVHCHGGPVAVRAVAGRLESAGLVQRSWPDFLRQRAAGTGTPRIEVECELLLAGVATLRASLVVAGQRNGLLVGAVEQLRPLVEGGRPDRALAAVDHLLARYERTGRFIEQPPRVAILGPANSGKSSLMNRLVGAERAIVTEIPGTTRDVVTETAGLDGLPVVLADTAGLRDSEDSVERLGVQRARTEAIRADLLLATSDLSRPRDLSAVAGLAEPGGAAGPVIRVGTKADLASATAAGEEIDLATSALTGQGIDELVRLILSRLGFCWPRSGQAVPLADRQASLLRQVRRATEQGRLAAALEYIGDLLG
ncbi:MAG: GTP-binding protein [Anaerolineaceae bacterium]|nr:GTP-binding protein [Anaerolineaceae bacterium]